VGELTIDGHEVLMRLREQPGGRELLDLARGRDDVELVGGAVRDLMLGRDPRELDVTVGSGEPFSAAAAAAFAGELATRLDAVSTRAHERFGTALVVWAGGRIDVTTRRAESYPVPGALPDVRTGTPEEDLRRRDFTVNAIAVTLDGTRPGEVRAPPGALEDLRAGRLRVLHDASFLDDPTRLLRLARYRARLGLRIEEHTAALAGEAVAAGALATISLARVGAELRLALGEAEMVAAIAAIDDLGLLQALPAELSFNEQRTREALALLSTAGATDTRPDLVVLAALLVPVGLIHVDIHEQARARMEWLLDEMEFLAADRDLVLGALGDGRHIAGELAFARTPSAIYEVASRTSLEAVALIGAVAAGVAASEQNPITEAARRWLAELHRVRLRITGGDLIAVGIPQGPEIGHRLHAALMRKLDGELADGRDAELIAALEAQP
jgi:tRNA nucleotidyltransferase (CCA-adding enzyme)